MAQLSQDLRGVGVGAPEKTRKNPKTEGFGWRKSVVCFDKFVGSLFVVVLCVWIPSIFVGWFLVGLVLWLVFTGFFEQLCLLLMFERSLWPPTLLDLLKGNSC